MPPRKHPVTSPAARKLYELMIAENVSKAVMKATFTYILSIQEELLHERTKNQDLYSKITKLSESVTSVFDAYEALKTAQSISKEQHKHD